MFEGSIVAIVTPLNSKDQVDRKALEQFVDWQIHEGTEGIVCCGTTGEGPLLSEKERMHVIQTCVEVADKRVPVIAGTGAISTRETVRQTEQAAELGVDGCLVVTPYYIRPSQEGLRKHYEEVMKVDIPIIAYNNPKRAGVHLEPTSLPPVAALKDSGPIQSWPVPVLCGEDHLLVDSIRSGSIGTISVIGNIIPRQWRLLVDLARQGEWEQAKHFESLYRPLVDAIYQTTNPQCVKAILSWMGKIHPVIRQPLVFPPLKVEEKIRAALLSLQMPFGSPKKHARKG